MHRTFGLKYQRELCVGSARLTRARAVSPGCELSFVDITLVRVSLTPAFRQVTRDSSLSRFNGFPSGNLVSWLASR